MIVNLIHLTQISVNYLSAAVEKRQSDVKILFCGLRFFKCKCRWRLIDTNGPTYECDQCSVTTAKCPFCEAHNVNEDNTRIECTYCHHDYDPITL